MNSGELHIGLVGVGRIGVMHARNLGELTGVGRLSIADANAEQAARVAAEVGADHRAGVTELLASGIDALVVAAATPAHPELILAALAAGLPVLCEKPVASDVASSLPALARVEASGGIVQIGHQRRFDPGYLEARRALTAGELGWIHSIRAVTCDSTPPPLSFIATSGGLFRDCSVHDFDVIAWLTGRRIVRVYAVGSNNGDPGIGAVGDVDTALAVCTLDDGTVTTASASRYNGAGHDVRLEIQGSLGSLEVGLDDQAALRSAEPGIAFPTGPPHATFAERFAQAYRDELTAFLELVRGERDNPCTPREAIAASLVADAAQDSLHSGVPVTVPSLDSLTAV